MTMPYPTIETDPQDKAAAALYGVLAGFCLSGQHSVARAVSDALTTEMWGRMNTLMERDVTTGMKTVLASAGTVDVATAVPVVRAVESPRQSWEHRVGVALLEVLHEVVPEFNVNDITTDDAFRHLVRRVQDSCEEDEVTPVVVLKRLGAGVLAAVTRVESPTQFLTAKVRDYEPDDQ